MLCLHSLFCHLFCCRAVSPALFYASKNKLFIWVLWGGVCVFVRYIHRWFMHGRQFLLPFTCFKSRPSRSLDHVYHADPCAFFRWIQSAACWEERWWLEPLNRPSVTCLEEEYKVKKNDTVTQLVLVKICFLCVRSVYFDFSNVHLKQFP